MRTQQLNFRMLAAEADLDVSLLQAGGVLDADMPRVAAARDRIAGGDHHFIEGASQTMEQIFEVGRALNREAQLDLVAVDYLN